jgi:hypothetical protein
MPRKYLSWPPILERAAAIVRGYDTLVTLRQLFYRLVAEELIPNDVSAYSVLSRWTAEARRAGTFPDLADLTRHIREPQTFTDPDDAREWLASIYRLDRTEGQERTIVLGVEKAGMVAQLEAWFWDLGVPIVALGGYASQTLADRIRRRVHEQYRPAILLYAGDHDPEGHDILRDLIERTDCWEEVVRVALDAEQVEHYGLPPQPGKRSSSRAAGFVAEHGELVQVELDALPPETLRGLYGDALGGWWDDDAYRAVLDREAELLEELLEERNEP